VVDKIKNAPRRVMSFVDGHAGLFIYPPGSDVVSLSGVLGEEGAEGEIKGRDEDFSLDDSLSQLESAVSYLLVDFAELTSKVQVSFEKNKVFLRMRHVKVNIQAPRFVRVLGSLPASLGACCIAHITGRPVRVLEEKGEGRWQSVIFEVGEQRLG